MPKTLNLKNGGILIMFDVQEVMELIHAYQSELDLSYCCIQRIEKNVSFLEEIAEAVNEYVSENNLQDVTFGKYDSHTNAIVDIIRKKLEY